MRLGRDLEELSGGGRTFSPAGRAVRLAEAVVTVAGDSMSPTLERGWVVATAPLPGPPAAGDVVLLETSGVFTLHRVVHVASLDGRRLVFHGGDAGGPVRAVPVEDVAAIATAIRRPAGQPLAPAARLPLAVRRRLALATVRARAYCGLRRLVPPAVRGLAALRAPARLLARLVLG